MDILREIEAHEKLVDEYRTVLETHAAACAEHPELHVLPALEKQKDDTTQLAIHIVNIKDGSVKSLKMEGGPARFFYNAYCEKLPEIFALAKEKADESVASRVTELKAKVAEEKKAIAEAEKTLAKYGKARTVKT